MISRSARIILVAAALGLGSTANAATYYLNKANEFAEIQTYATVDVDLLGSGNVKFTVTLAPFLVALNQAIDEFGFNVTYSSPDLTSANIVNSSVAGQGWVFAGQSNAQNQSMDGFGKYNYSYGVSGAAGREPSPLTFEVAVAADTAASYVALANGGGNCASINCYFSLHIVNQAGYDPYRGKTFYVGGGDEDDFAPPVPLPAAGWLLGSALLALFGIGRKRVSVA